MTAAKIIASTLPGYLGYLSYLARKPVVRDIAKGYVSSKLDYLARRDKPASGPSYSHTTTNYYTYNRRYRVNRYRVNRYRVYRSNYYLGRRRIYRKRRYRR